MNNFENSKDVVSMGKQIGHDLGAHNWQDASAALSKCANDLGPDDFRRLVHAADLANNDSSGITFDAVYALEKRPASDPVTNIETTRLQKNFLGVEVGLNVSGSHEKPVLITDPKDLAPQVLKFASIYEEMGLSAHKA